MTHKDEARVLAHQRCAKCGNYGDSPSHLVGCAVASSPDPDEPLTPYGEALIQRVEDYRSGYSCGYSDAKNGTRMRDKDAASLFFNIGGVPDVSEHQLSQADRVEELAREICRELYDRFVMGGWEPQDAHAQLAALLRPRMERAERSFWVVERFDNGKSAGYWTGASSRDFTTEIDKAIQFRRRDDAFWITRGWHWTDIKLTEHMCVQQS